MCLANKVDQYIICPFPFWNETLSIALAKNKWTDLAVNGLPKQDAYSTSWVITKNSAPEVKQHIGNGIYYEPPSFDLLGDFYDGHGLNISTGQEFESDNGISKLRGALNILGLVKPVLAEVSALVRSIQIIRQPDPEIDVSYSHPKVPFTIFVSLCKDSSVISNLRVAESILHEAMHLKLSLIEEIVPLAKPFNGELYYSPWRDEKRPAQGVLHGAFVFRGIFEFYTQVQNSLAGEDIHSYLDNRKKQIDIEFRQLEQFIMCPDLTQNGANLLTSLLPLS